MSLNESKENMSAFLAEIADKRRAAEASRNIRGSRAYRFGLIAEKKAEATKNAAREVFLTIYRKALPLDNTHKETFQSNLDNRMLDLVERNGASDVYDYLKKSDSKHAKTICSSVDRYMAEACSRFYEETDEDLETIDVGKDSPIVSNVVQKVTSDMSVDEVSAIIEDNVRATIAKEMAATKEEDEKLAELEESLAADDSVVTEGAIESALINNGFKPYGIYTPSLFNGIMIGEVTKLQKSGVTGEAAQKQAFYESVQELTALQTLSTLDMIDINPRNIDAMSRNYAAGRV